MSSYLLYGTGTIYKVRFCEYALKSQLLYLGLKLNIIKTNMIIFLYSVLIFYIIIQYSLNCFHQYCIAHYIPDIVMPQRQPNAFLFILINI